MSKNLEEFPLPVETQARLAARTGFSTTGDGGNGGYMEARIARLETAADRVDDRLRSVEVGIATLSERVAHLPSKGFIVTATVSAITLLSALILFGEKLLSLLG